MTWLIIKAAFGGLFSSLFARWLPKKDPEVKEYQHALAAKQQEARILAAPVPSDDALADIVRRHQPKQP